MKIFDDIWYYRYVVRSICNVYIFKDGPDLDFIDTGFRLGTITGLLREIQKDGLDPRNIRSIFHGHWHFDHVQSDAFFQHQAVRHRGQVKVYVPRPDLFRTRPEYSIIASNFREMKNHFPNTSLDMFQGINRLGKFVFEPLINSEIPHNICPMDNEQKIQIGKRTATIHITGGHTEGHSFFHFNDADNILHTGDHDALNEFTCNWKHTLESVRLAQQLSPDNVFIGHNLVKFGHDKAMGFINGYFRQFDGIFAPMLPYFKRGQQINLTNIARRMMGWIGKIRPALLVLNMNLYAICKYFEELKIGTLFQIDQNPADIALLDIIRYGRRMK
jgi:glyoxylase-like metal-dependent hydrolase (beta-lactamase superfamily II)